jgi:hypothetical protein
MAWLEANRLLPIADYHARFCAAFGRDVPPVNLQALRKRKGWKTGRTGHFPKGHAPANKGKPHPSRGRSAETRFKAGRLPHNTKSLGHEYTIKGGYIMISVAETNPHTGFERRFVLKHVHLWEQANGPLPKGHCLKCLDGDRANTDPSNWELIPRALLTRLNGGPRGRHLSYAEAAPEVRPTLIAIAKGEHAVGARRRRTRAA